MFRLKHPANPTDLHRRFFIAAAACDGFALAVGVLVLVGWWFQIERLKRVGLGFVQMSPLTAVSLLLTGTAFLLLLRQPPRRWMRIAALALCLPSVVLGLTRLLALFTSIDLDFDYDEWLFRSTLHGNRLAPNTTACMLLNALALMLIDVKWPRGIRPAQLIALTSGGLALVALIGYIYSSQALYRLPTFYPMAVHTAVSTLFFCFAILSARPDKGVMAVVTGDNLGGMLARRLMVVTVAAPILLGWLRMAGVRRGLMSEQLGDALLAMCLVAFFSALVWVNARLLRRIDAERQRAQKVMQQAEVRYRAVVQQTAEGIYLLDARTKRIVESNAAFRNLLGYSDDEINQLTAYDIVNHSQASIDQRIAEIIEQGQAAMGERQYKRRDGTPVDVQANASAITYDGQTVLCTVVHDITRRKRNEREIQYKNQQLEEIAESERKALAELKRTQSQLVQTEKLAGLGQMVAGVAHEINNPLSFVSNNVAVLQRDLAGVRQLLELYQTADGLVEAGNKTLSDEIRELSGRIDLPYTLKNSHELMDRSREGLRRIQQIVKDLREFARLDESDLHEVNLNEGIASTVNIIRGTAKKHQVEIELDLQPLPPFACYPAKVNQVVMNLLSNAIDASNESSKVIVRSRSTENGAVEIQVEDQGTGIAPDAIPRIFDPFYTTKPPGQGTGLGLSISYGIVQDHGGTIEVQSEVGKGTCFTVRLPKRDAGGTGTRG